MHWGLRALFLYQVRLGLQWASWSHLGILLSYSQIPFVTLANFLVDYVLKGFGICHRREMFYFPQELREGGPSLFCHVAL